MAANVTFLFQSKTQQGVPSVWHRRLLTSPMPFCEDRFRWQFAKNLSFLAFFKKLNITLENRPLYTENQKDLQMNTSSPKEPSISPNGAFSALVVFFLNEQIPHCHGTIYLGQTCLLKMGNHGGQAEFPITFFVLRGPMTGSHIHIRVQKQKQTPNPNGQIGHHCIK